MNRVVTCALLAAVASCASNPSNPDSAGGDDAGSGSGGPAYGDCSVTLTTDPTAPLAGATVQVRATFVNVPGAFTYQWSVGHDGAAVDVTMTETGVAFVASTPGVYDISLILVGAPAPCAVASRALNVTNPLGRSETLRLRVLAPQSYAAAPLEVYEQILGGANAQDIGVVVMPAGSLSTLRVVDGGGAGLASYVQLSPAGAPDAIVEAFTGDDGNATAVLNGGLYNALVVPSSSAVAPRRISGWTAGPMSIAAGQLVTGTVKDPEMHALADARVQLAVDGVPSTVATTDAGGHFAVRAPSGTAVAVEVVPPSSTGLPRLAVTSGFDLGAAMQINYASNVNTVDLTGVPVRRAGAGVAGAQVTIVGAVGAVGTVTAGAMAPASGTVAVSATTLAGGALPALRVPAAALSAVITVSPGDVAVTAFDATSAASLDAPAMQLITTAVTDGAGHRLAGAVLDLVPAGALATAQAPPIRAIADATGAITARIAAGGHYDLRLRDPAGRGAPTVVLDRTTATIATSIALGAPLAVRGQLLYAGHQPLAGAAVQLLCNDCTGLERTRPIAEGQTDAGGRFTLGVPDPGLIAAQVAPR